MLGEIIAAVFIGFLSRSFLYYAVAGPVSVAMLLGISVLKGKVTMQ